MCSHVILDVIHANIQFKSSQMYLYSALHNTNKSKSPSQSLIELFVLSGVDVSYTHMYIHARIHKLKHIEIGYIEWLNEWHLFFLTRFHFLQTETIFLFEM